MSEDFKRIVRPAAVPMQGRNGKPRRAPLWLTISYKAGRLSIMGVEGPLSNGDALGSCGQCGIDDKAVPLKGFTCADLARLREIWDRWHLNDMRPLSPEMRAAGWLEKARLPMAGYHFSMTAAASAARRKAEAAALAAAKAGETFTPSAEQVEALTRPYGVTIWTHEGDPEPVAPEGMERERHIGGYNTGSMMAPERKTLGWLKPDEHPDGLLCRKLHPDDECGYGGKWWFEAVPRGVLDWLRALPEPEGERHPWGD